MQNKETVEELHNTNIRKFKKQKVHSSYTDNVWVLDFAHMQVLSKLIKEKVLQKKVLQLLMLFKKL